MAACRSSPSARRWKNWWRSCARRPTRAAATSPCRTRSTSCRCSTASIPMPARIGAVNTVIKQADGTLEGRNSDGFGFLAAPQGERARLEGRRRAGGGAGRRRRRPRRGLHADGCRRARAAPDQPHAGQRGRISASPSRPRTAGASPSSAGTSAPTRSMAPPCWSTPTSLGMTGKPPLEIDLGKLPKTAVVDDIVYMPLETDLLAAARGRAATPASTGSACCCTRAAWASRRGSARTCHGERRAAPRRRRRPWCVMGA